MLSCRFLLPLCQNGNVLIPTQCFVIVNGIVSARSLFYKQLIIDKLKSAPSILHDFICSRLTILFIRWVCECGTLLPIFVFRRLFSFALILSCSFALRWENRIQYEKWSVLFQFVLVHCTLFTIWIFFHHFNTHSFQFKTLFYIVAVDEASRARDLYSHWIAHIAFKAEASNSSTYNINKIASFSLLARCFYKYLIDCSDWNHYYFTVRFENATD